MFAKYRGRSERSGEAWQLLALLAIAGCVLGATASTAHAQNRIFRCAGPDGAALYQNVAGKGCREVPLTPLTSIPAPRLPAAARTSASAGHTATATPGSFPRVDPATQRDRDSDRRQILQQELQRERGKLAELKSAFNSGEPERNGDERNYQKYLDRVEQMKADIARVEGNVNSLQREVDTAR